MKSDKFCDILFINKKYSSCQNLFTVAKYRAVSWKDLSQKLYIWMMDLNLWPAKTYLKSWISKWWISVCDPQRLVSNISLNDASQFVICKDLYQKLHLSIMDLSLQPADTCLKYCISEWWICLWPAKICLKSCIFPCCISTCSWTWFLTKSGFTNLFHFLKL